MFIAIATITLGALGLSGGLQELVIQGIGNNQLIPLVGGTVGAVSGSLMVAAGIALLRQTPLARPLTRAAAWLSLGVALLIGMLGWGLAGWPMTIVGVAWPVFLLLQTGARREDDRGRIISA